MAVESPRNSVFFLFLGFLVVSPRSVLVVVWDCVRVQVPARKDDSDFQVFPFDLAMKGGRGGHGARRFYRAAQVLRDQAHRLDYFLFSN